MTFVDIRTGRTAISAGVLYRNDTRQTRHVNIPQPVEWRAMRDDDVVMDEVLPYTTYTIPPGHILWTNGMVLPEGNVPADLPDLDRGRRSEYIVIDEMFSPVRQAIATIASTPEGTTAMPQIRDEHGRFTSAPVEKTPVTDVAVAAEQFHELTVLMNKIANEDGLCSTFDGVVNRIVERTPAITKDTPTEPEWTMTWHVQGTVYLDPSYNGREGGRSSSERLGKVLAEEFDAWAAEHDLDKTKGGTFLAWVDTLPDNRKRINPQHWHWDTPGEDREIYLAHYAERSVNQRRPVNMVLAPAATQPEQPAQPERPAAAPAQPKPTSERVFIQDVAVNANTANAMVVAPF